MTLIQAFIDQAVSCEALGSPFTGKVLRCLAETWDHTGPLGQAMAAYSGDIGPAGHSLPLRIAGGLHALVRSGQDSALQAVYPPRGSADVALADVIPAALLRHQEFFLDWTRLPPQTNEVRRSAALIPMAYTALQRFDLPIYLSELGASGGLNLMWDHYALQAGETRIGPDQAAITFAPEWSGPAPAPLTPRIAHRAGVDLNPLDPRKPEDLLRLTSYIWPDQPDRLERTEQAARIFDADVARGDAIDWLAARLNAIPEGHLHLIQNTVAWQYFDAESQARGRALIEEAGQKASENKPLAWMQMETEGDKTGAAGAVLTLRMWPGDVTLHLGRADFHGRWVTWKAPQE